MERILINNNKIVTGINWGIIEEKGWFGAKGYASVDLDLNIILINPEGTMISEHNWKNRETDIIRLSKDDTTGDVFENDHLDNEYAEINLEKIPENQKALVFVNNYTEQELGKITHFDYRIYSGEPNKPDTIFHYFDLTRLDGYENSYGIFLGYLETNKNTFSFTVYERCLTKKGLKNCIEEVLECINT